MKLPIGKAIAYFRDIREMSQTDLAKDTGIRQPTISLYESDKRTPIGENLEKIAHALRVSIADIEEKANEIKNDSRIKNYSTMPRDVGRAYSRPSVRRSMELNFYITEDVSVTLRSLVRENSREFRNNYRNTPINEIVESAIMKYLEINYNEIHDIIMDELEHGIDDIEKFIEDLRNNY